MDDGIGGIVGDVAGVFGEELKKIGKTAVSQITGKPGDQQSQVSAGDLKTIVASDKKFSKKGEAEVKAKIAQIYQEYALKRAKEQKQEQLVQERQEEQRKLEVREIKKQEMADPSIAKTRAEIKNYGNE